MRKWSRLTILYISILASGIALVAGVFLFYVNPVFEERRQLAEQWDQLELQRMELQAKITPELAANADLDLLMQRVPAEMKRPRFIRQLRQSERITGITIESMTFPEKDDDDSVPEDLQGIERQQISMQIRGNYPQLIKMVDHLQQMERLVHINSWEISQLGSVEGDDGPSLEMNLSIEIFSAPHYAELIPEDPDPLLKNPNPQRIPFMNEDDFLRKLP